MAAIGPDLKSAPAPALRRGLAVLQICWPAGRRRCRPGRSPATSGWPGRRPTSLLTELAAAGFAVHLPAERRWGLGVGRLRDRHRLSAVGATGATRPADPATAGRIGQGDCPSGCTARTADAVPGEGEGARPHGDPGDGRRHPAAGRTHRDRPVDPGRLCRPGRSGPCSRMRPASWTAPDGARATCPSSAPR